MTIEGETILSHRLVISPRRTPLPFEALPEHFERGGERGHDGARSVPRARLEVGWPAPHPHRRGSDQPGRPGDEAVFDLRATDAQGVPWRRSLSLVAVDEALIARWGDARLVGPRRGDLSRAGLHDDLLHLPLRGPNPRDRPGHPGRGRSAGGAGGVRRRSGGPLEQPRRSATSGAWSTRTPGGSPSASRRRGLRPGAPAPEEEFEEDAFNNAIGIGGGAGGKFGGRFGGRRSLSARGGSAAYARTPGELNGDTLVWIPDVVTDAEGRAQVRVRVPERSTSWRLVARGVGANTLVGGAESTFTTRSSVHLELRVPAGLTAGDRPAPTVLLHDAEGRTGACTVTLEAASDEERRTFTRTIELEGAGVQSLAFPELEAVTAGTLRLTATARMEDADVDLARTSKERAVRPYGLRFVTSAGGPLDERVDTLLELPTGRTYRDRTLRLRIGTGLSRLLLDEALGLGPAWRCGVPIDRERRHSDEPSSGWPACCAVPSRGAAWRPRSWRPCASGVSASWRPSPRPSSTMAAGPPGREVAVPRSATAPAACGRSRRRAGRPWPCPTGSSTARRRTSPRRSLSSGTGRRDARSRAARPGLGRTG